MIKISSLFMLTFTKFEIIIVVLLIVFFFVTLILIGVLNYYPTKKIEVDITNVKKMNNSDVIDYYLTKYGKQKILEHINTIEDWKNKKKAKASERRVKFLEKNWDKNKSKAFLFEFYHKNTRYKQVNYIKYPYKVKVISNRFYVSYEFLLERIKFLEDNDYYVIYKQTTKYDQRRAMTKELKDYIKKRDGHKCQVCGKFMPDEVGLHIEHIIPTSRGGKSIPNNLRVICSKCNAKKGRKVKL